MKARNPVLAGCTSLAVIAISGMTAPAFAAEKDAQPLTAWEASRTTDSNDMVTTGVAKGRDRLNSATSTSSIKENEITKLAPRSMADLFRNIPGIRVEAAAGEGSNGYTVRGLPLVGEGAKYLQIQEDGLPVMEFGDFSGTQSDNFTRIDLNIGSVESIRGGSSSTFASNAPGGVINLISKTGEVEGGSAQVTGGLDYGLRRLDFDYGGHLSENWRFHVGGFYRDGEGPRRTGLDTYHGGQVKFNLTRQFEGGYIRFYGKYLDDHAPSYRQYPAAITGTNSDPKFHDLADFSLNRDSLFSKNIPTSVTVEPDGSVRESRFSDALHVMSKSGGIEAQFELHDWTITERFRYSAMSLSGSSLFPVFAASPAVFTAAFQIPGATYTYASGPLKGTPFDATRGSGLLALDVASHTTANNLDNVTNDIRGSRVWNVGGGDLTATAGLYTADQRLKRILTLSTIVQDVQGDGESALINIAAAGGFFPISQNGVLSYAGGTNGSSSNSVDVRYKVAAPYGSFNFHKGRIAVGASARYDFGNVNGDVQSGSIPFGCVDVNRDGVTIPGTAECQTAVFALGGATPVDYRYGYLSYSAGVNFRMSDPLALFARYSRGSRAGADAILFSPAISTTNGRLLDKNAGYDPVKQLEGGLKYRQNGITFNVTGFYATTSETNTQLNQDANGQAQAQLVSRGYKAYGAEFEGGLRRGPFSVAAGATVAKAEITRAETASITGNKPRHQPTLIYQVTPQFDTDLFAIGANVVGTTSSYAQDVNQLKLPGYTTVGVFAQVRPVKRLELSLNVTNLFNTKAVTETLEASMPASGVIFARTLYGRLVSTSARFFF